MANVKIYIGKACEEKEKLVRPCGEHVLEGQEHAVSGECLTINGSMPRSTSKQPVGSTLQEEEADFIQQSNLLEMVGSSNGSRVTR